MIAFTSVASFVKLPLTHVLPQAEVTLLRQLLYCANSSKSGKLARLISRLAFSIVV